MAKNSAAQYEVVAVDNEDGIQWWRWCWWQRSVALKIKAMRWRVKSKMAFDTSASVLHGDVQNRKIRRKSPYKTKPPCHPLSVPAPTPVYIG
jgi:hypothetical protein